MYTVLIVFILIVFDVVTGVTKGLSQGKISSKYLRQGLFRKTGEIFTMFGGWLFEYANIRLHMEMNIPLLETICVYIALMETISIIENICVINPEMCKLFKPYLEKLKGRSNEKRD